IAGPHAASSEPAAIERDQALPVPLGRRLVVDLALREGEAMVDARIHLELTGAAGFLEQAAQLLDHRQRRQLVMLRAGDVEFTLALAERQMRALDRVADEPGAVERGRSRDAVGIARGGSECIGPAHAVADGSEPARHVAQLLADAGGVHQEQHGWMRTALRPADEGLHRAGFGSDVQGLLDHDLVLPMPPAYAILAATVTGVCWLEPGADTGAAYSPPPMTKARLRHDEGGGPCVRDLDRPSPTSPHMPTADLSRWTHRVGV